ncbi:hypothetical protein AB0J40_07365 [Amycolatopsis sp. NPDC049691]|uniref:hypothetical protein n=1 Tax=Amycolatopsis sp. NPDC049691 TaxID=3155155 RepID=UPI00342F6F2A
MQLASAVVSVAALIVACVSLWRTHLATFSPRLAVGRLSLFADQTTLDREWWYVPRVVVAVNVTNAGARAGVITDARVVARYPDHPVADAHEIFGLNGELDPAKYHTLKSHKDLFREAYRGDGTPFVVLAKETVGKLLLFGTRWDHEARLDHVRWELQLRVNGGNWRTVQRWTQRHHGSDDFVWRELRNGSSFSYEPDDPKPSQVTRHPDDLHDPKHWT